MATGAKRMRKPKPIQIACQAPSQTEDGEYLPLLFALCDDGSIWKLTVTLPGSAWEPVHCSKHWEFPSKRRGGNEI